MAVNGILGIKLGMAQVFTDDGQAVGCTVLQAGPCVVVQRRTKEKDGYDAAQLGLVEFIKPQRVRKPMAGHFKKADVAPMRRLRRSSPGGFRRRNQDWATACWWTVSLPANLSMSPASAKEKVCRRREALALPRRRRHARFDASPRAGRHWRRARFLRACGRDSIFRDTWATPQVTVEESAGRESGYGREPAAGVRLGSRPGGHLLSDSQSARKPK